MRKKREKKPKEKKIELVEVSNMWRGIQEYKTYESIPEELKVTEEHIGKRLEIAGFKRTDYFKLQRINEDNVLVIDGVGQYRNFRLNAIVLHRNEKMRNSTININDLYFKQVNKISDMGKNRKRVRRKKKEVEVDE